MSHAQRRERRAVAVLVSRFPHLTETFILRELIELERLGQPVRLVPLIRQQPAVVHPEAQAWVDRALYSPFISAPIAVANLRALSRAPLAYIKTLLHCLVANLASPRFFVAVLALFPKCVYLAERLQNEGIQHVHAHFATHPTLAAYIIAAFSDISYSFTVHAHDLFERRAMLGQKIRGARFVRAISGFNQRYMEERYPAAARGKIEVLHLGVDPERYAAPPPRPEAGSPPVLLSVAALRPSKGLPVLVRACRLLVDAGLEFLCEIVGEGSERARLERLVQQLGLDGVVRLTGGLPQEEVVQRLRQASVFVLPSVVTPSGRMEGIPVALMEAMAASRPVVASRLSGIPELVEDGVNGLLVEPGDVGAVAAALRRLLEGPEFAAGLGAEGRKTIERDFCLKDSVRQLLGRLDAHSPPPPERLPCWLSEELPAEASLGVRWTLEGRDAALVALLIGDGSGPREWVLKTHRSVPGESYPAPERARFEFDTLSHLASLDGAEQGVLEVPKPVGIEGRALLMEACKGRPLVDWIRARRWSREPEALEALAGAIACAGRWLQSTLR